MYRKTRAPCYPGLSYVYFSKKCQNYHSVGEGAHKVEENFFLPNLTLIFPIFRDHEKGKPNVFKKVSFSTFKELQ